MLNHAIKQKLGIKYILDKNVFMSISYNLTVYYIQHFTMNVFEIIDSLKFNLTKISIAFWPTLWF